MSKSMKTKYKFIEVIKVNDVAPDELPYWFVKNRKHKYEVGRISWYQTWKRFVFFPGRNSLVFSSDCLEDIAHFIKQLEEKK